MTLSLILGAAYFIVLIALGIYTATFRLWLPYFAGCVVFLVILFTGLNWAANGENGPSGFAVVAAHGLVFWVALIAHAIKWLRILISFIKSFIAARNKSQAP